MSVTDAFSCPYCGGALLKESYYFRCRRDHRFRSTIEEAGALGEPGGSRALGGLVLEVVSHPERAQIGRRHRLTLGEA